MDVKDYSTTLMQNAIKRYELLYVSDEERMVKAAKKAYTKLIDKVENIDFNAVDANGKAIDTPATLNAAFKNISEYQNLLNSIDQGIAIKKNKNKAVGGTTVGAFEEAKEQTKEVNTDSGFVNEDLSTDDLQDDNELEPASY